MKLAHFSDIHVTHFPPREGWQVKRLLASLSFWVSGRGKHFEGSEARIAALLEDVDAQGVGHALCSGDLTGVSGKEEFRRCAELFGPRLEQPERFTVLAGNHDRYVSEAAGRYEAYFAQLSGAEVFPAVKKIAPNVTLVLLDSARPTSIVDSSGLVGEAQRGRLLEILTDTALQSQFVVVALHYGLLRKNGQRDRRNHGLRDDLELMQLLDRPDVSVDLVLHGHLHTPFVQRTQKRVIVNAGSATDLHLRCGYHVYDIEPSLHQFRIARREWNALSQRYEPAQQALHQGVIATRR